MKSLHLYRYTICFAAMLLTGCGINHHPSFSKMSESYAQSLAQYQTDSILMNIVRSAEERPLSFLDIPSINGSGNVSTSLGTSSTFGGIAAGNISGALVGLGPTSQIAYGTSFTFTQSSLDNATFLKGFLNEVPLKTAFNFRTGRIPKELLFTLLIESIHINSPQGEKVYVNNPLDQNYEEFQSAMYGLMNAGLDISEIKPDRLNIAGNKKSGSNSASAKEIEKDYRFCLKPTGTTKSGDLFSREMYCNLKTSSNAVAFAEDRNFSISIRSPRGVFNFLGEVVVAQTSEPRFLLRLPLLDKQRNRKDGQTNRNVLMLVIKDPASTMPIYASAHGIDGDVFAIPLKDNGYSPMVIDIMYQMVTLCKISGSIPQQPSVIVK